MTRRPPRLAGSDYTASHAAFRARSDQQERMLEQLMGQFSRPISPPRSVLSVGCGAGLFDLALAQRLRALGGQPLTVGLDPNPAQIAAFRERFAEAGLPCRTVEEPFEKAKITERFELVLFSHSLYYLSDPLEALRRGRQLLAPGGRVVVFHGTRRGLKQVRGALLSALGVPERAFFGADALAEALTQARIPFTHETLQSVVDVTLCMTPDSPEGEALMSFLVQTRWADLPEPIQAQVRGALKPLCTRDGDTWTLGHPFAAFTLSGAEAEGR